MPRTQDHRAITRLGHRRVAGAMFPQQDLAAFLPEQKERGIASFDGDGFTLYKSVLRSEGAENRPVAGCCAK